MRNAAAVADFIDCLDSAAISEQRRPLTCSFFVRVATDVTVRRKRRETTTTTTTTAAAAAAATTTTTAHENRTVDFSAPSEKVGTLIRSVLSLPKKAPRTARRSHRRLSTGGGGGDRVSVLVVVSRLGGRATGAAHRTGFERKWATPRRSPTASAQVGTIRRRTPSRAPRKWTRPSARTSEPHENGRETYIKGKIAVAATAAADCNRRIVKRRDYVVKNAVSEIDRIRRRTEECSRRRRLIFLDGPTV